MSVVKRIVVKRDGVFIERTNENETEWYGAERVSGDMPISLELRGGITKVRFSPEQLITVIETIKDKFDSPYKISDQLMLEVLRFLNKNIS